jgi:hypothetical protein
LIASIPFSALAFVSSPWLAAMISPFRALRESEFAGVILRDLELGCHHLSLALRVVAITLTTPLEVSPLPEAAGNRIALVHV